VLTHAYKGDIPKLTEEEVKAYTRDLDKLGDDMVNKFPAAIDALRAQYAPMPPDVLREQATQDRIFQVLNAHSINDD
jgi:hypothetical protein